MNLLILILLTFRVFPNSVNYQIINKDNKNISYCDSVKFSQIND